LRAQLAAHRRRGRSRRRRAARRRSGRQPPAPRARRVGVDAGRRARRVLDAIRDAGVRVMNRDRIGLGTMVRAGARTASHYTGTVLGVFVVQALLAGAAGFAIMQVLASEFAKAPRFDEAVAGDLTALFECVKHAPSAFRASFWIGASAVFLWIV